MRKLLLLLLPVLGAALLASLAIARPKPSLTVRFSHYAVTNNCTWGYLAISNSSKASVYFGGGWDSFFTVATRVGEGWGPEQTWLGPYGARGAIAASNEFIVPIVVQTNADWRVRLRFGREPFAARFPRQVRLFVPTEWMTFHYDHEVWSPRIEKPKL
jgi:hypothetical protein